MTLAESIPSRSAVSTGAPGKRVSIGLPVFNGAAYLREAIESILQQTYCEFELIVTDNASTDATQSICEEFVARDPRVRYVRLPENIGAAPNFNRAFELCSGELFKWAAHDDLLDPRFLEECVAALDANPSAVLAYPRSVVIGSDGAEIEPYTLKLPTDHDDPVRRFDSLVRGGHKCFEVFGLIRRSALLATPLMGSYSHGDGVLLARLALRGRFAEIPEPLFFPRRHEQQSMAMLNEDKPKGRERSIDYVSYAAWFDSRLRGKRVYPTVRMGIEFGKSVLGAPIGLIGRLRCIGSLFRWAWIYRGMLRGDLKRWLRLSRGTR